MLLFQSNNILCQDSKLYNDLTKEAWSLYLSKDYINSARKYSEAFIAIGNHGTNMDRYNAACVWTLAVERDSAFIQLFTIANDGKFTKIDQLYSDSIFISLHKDKRWAELLLIVGKNKEVLEANFDHHLVAVLDTVYNDDQNYRMKINWIRKKYGWESIEMTALWDTINIMDSINTIKIKNVLDNRGWLSAKIIGKQGNRTLFLVIQHSNFETQKQYLPMMRKAVKKGNATASLFASLEDRVELQKGKKQNYGTQLGRNKETGELYVKPLKKIKTVEKRRRKMGMPTMNEYLSNWNLTWDVNEYKIFLREFNKLKN